MKKTLVHNHNKNEVCEPCNVAMGMYQCYHCGKWSYKENWGPGWVRCPLCKAVAPSAAQAITLKEQDNIIERYAVKIAAAVMGSELTTAKNILTEFAEELYERQSTIPR